MEISAYLHRTADLLTSNPRKQESKQQSIIKAFAKALEVIPRQLCDNAGYDATNILTQLRVEHRKGNTWAGVDFDNEGVRDNMKAFVWEPSLVKVNAIQAAVEAGCLILSVDETISTFSPSPPLLFLYFFAIYLALEYWIYCFSVFGFQRIFPLFPCRCFRDGQYLLTPPAFPNRKRTFRTTPGAAARFTARGRTESAKGERERDAEKMKFMDTVKYNRM